MNTAEKTAPDTALIRNYRLLDTPPGQDVDSDGLTNAQEDLNGNGVFDAGVEVLINGHDETNYNNVPDNGTCAGGTGYTPGDVITLDDGTKVTVDAVALSPVNAQNESNYNGLAGNGTFAGGGGYVNGEIITLTDGTTVTVVSQTAGVVDQFTVDSTTATDFSTVAAANLIQDTSNGIGAGFSLTVEAPNLDGDGSVIAFTVDSTASAREPRCWCRPCPELLLFLQGAQVSTSPPRPTTWVLRQILRMLIRTEMASLTVLRPIQAFLSARPRREQTRTAPTPMAMVFWMQRRPTRDNTSFITLMTVI